MAHNSERDVRSPAARGIAVERAVAPTRFHRVSWVGSTGSTNDDLAALAADGAPEQVRIADLQTAGRGRRDRVWTAPAESAVLLSALIRDRRGAAPFWTIASVALGAAEAASSLVDAEVQLKWPNDLLIAGGKVAGILSQGVGDAVIAGIGTNVNWQGTRPEGVPDHATSLDEHAPGPIDRVAYATRLVTRAAHWLDAPLPVLRSAWTERCVTIGQHVRVETAPDPILGAAVGITVEGALQVVDQASGKERILHVGDVVHVRPQEP